MMHTQDYDYALWPNGTWVTYATKDLTERGTIPESAVIGWYPTADEAKDAIMELNNGR